MNLDDLKHYGSIGLLVAAVAALAQTARQSYSFSVAEKDSRQLSAHFNDTHHLEINADVIKGNDGVTHNLSRLRIESNSNQFPSYSYSWKDRKIEGYEFSPSDLPDFVKGAKALSDIHQKACAALQKYAAADTTYLTQQAEKVIKHRQQSVDYLLRNNCS